MRQLSFLDRFLTIWIFLAMLMYKTAMVRRMGIGLMAFFFLLVSVSSAVSEEQKAPKAVVLQKGFDFGTVMEGDTITHSFKIANHGEDALTISRVQPG